MAAAFLFFLINPADAAEFTPHPYWTNPPVAWDLPINEPLKDHIKSFPPATGRLVIHENGAPQFVLDGKDAPSFMAWNSVNLNFNEDYLGTGIKTHVVRIDTGFIKNFFWIGENKYNPAPVANLLWDVLKTDPDAYIIVHIRIEPYRGWDQAHPDEVMRNEKGEPAVVSSHFLHYGDPVPDRSKVERQAWSFFSDVWKNDSAEMLRAFVQTVEASVPGRRVVGYAIGGGQDNQLYFWHPPNHVLSTSADLWGDYSEPARRAWKKWAEARYSTIEKLNSAWGTSYHDFAEVQPAPSKLLVAGKRFSDPRTEQVAIDWKTFLADGRADLLCHYASVVTEASTVPRLVGMMGVGPTGARRDSNSLDKMMDCKDIDYFVTQVSYGKRNPGQLGGISSILSSYALNGKVFIADTDHPTWLVEPIVSTVGTGVKYVPDTRGHAKNIDELQTMWLRDMSRLWANNAGPMLHGHAKPYQYHDLGIRSLMRSIYQMAPEMSGTSPQGESAEVAVIFDERSVHVAQDVSLMESLWNTAAAGEFAASGVPYRMYYAKDLREGRLPKFKMVVFVNQLQFDDPICKGIQRLKEEGTTLVFMQSAGYLQSYTDMKRVSETIGINLARMEQEAPNGVRLSAGYDNLKKWLTAPLADPEKRRVQHGRAAGQLPYYDTGLTMDQEAGLQVVDAQAEALAFYPGSSKVAAAVRDHGRYKTAFVGAYLLDRNVISELASMAGAWRLAPPDNVVEANSKFIMIHPLESGAVDLQLKNEKILVRYPDGDIKTPKSDHHTLRLSKDNTYLFRLMD